MRLDQTNNKSLFKIDNPFFSRGDGEFLYQFLRHTKPKRIIEIGSGYSTLISSRSNFKNKIENYKCDMTCIDPGDINIISKLKIKRIKKKVESCNISYF